MPLNTNIRSKQPGKIFRIISKVALPVLIIAAILYFLGQLEMPAPEKLIQQKISNDKLIIVK